MKIHRLLLLTSIFALGSMAISAQSVPQTDPGSLLVIDNISRDTQKIAKSIEALNERLKVFSETFSSNQGLRLTERQQKLLAAFEFLNRAEQRLATLQKHKVEMGEKLTEINIKLGEIEDQLRPESVDRSIAMRGTTNAQELRDNRRQLLTREKSELSNLINQIRSSIIDTDGEISDTIRFLNRIRHRIFPEIENELLNL